MSHNTIERRTRVQHRDGTRRDIDVAIGILIGLRGYSERAAFDELVAATHCTGTGITSVAQSLIALARGCGDSTPAAAAARRLWGDTLTGRPVYV